MARSLWYATFCYRERTPREQSIVAVASDEFADGSSVDLSRLYPQIRLPSAWVAHLRHDPQTRRLVGLSVRGHSDADAVPLWFVEHPEPDADEAAHTLIAFSGAGVAAGQVLTPESLLSRSIAPGDQVGALRWWTATGQIHQIYVAPQRRRQGIGGALLHAGGARRVSYGWPGLWSDGQRTDLGEAFVQGGPCTWQHRYRPRTHDLAPMTPTDPTPTDRDG